MDEQNAGLKDVPVAFSKSMASERLTDVAAEAADIGLDAMVSSGAMDGVPIFGALTGVWRAGVAMRDHIFAKKVASFLVTFSKTPTRGENGVCCQTVAAGQIG